MARQVQKRSGQAGAHPLHLASEDAALRTDAQPVAERQTRTYNRHALIFCRDGLGFGHPKGFPTSSLNRFQREHDRLKALDGRGLFTEDFGDLVEVHLPVTFESVSEALRHHAAGAMGLAGNPIPLGAAKTPTTATRIVWGVGANGASVVTEMTALEAAQVFVRWGVAPEIASPLVGAAVPDWRDRPAHGFGDVDAWGQPYPYLGAYVPDSVEHDSTLTDLFRRLEAHKVLTPSRPWWARAYERLVARFGEDLIILAACALTAAFFFGRTVWSLYHASSA